MLIPKEADLRRIVNYHGFKHNVDDVLQDLYVKLMLIKNIDRYLNKDNEPNLFIIFIIIKNMIYDMRKKQKNLIDIDSVQINLFDEQIENFKYDFILNQVEIMGQKFKNEKHLSDWFKWRLIDLYVTDGHSLRSLAKDTKISFNTIQKIFSEFKKQCNEKFDKIKFEN